MANTGNLLQQQIDINPNSPTYNTTRVVSLGPNLGVCPLPVTYSSLLISESVTKNDCPSGQFGSTVLYTVPAGSFTSTASQADADFQARAYFDSTKQSYANTNGACSFTPPGPAFVPYYLVTNNGEYGCFSCLMVNPNDPNDTRDATQAEIDLYQRANSTKPPYGPCPSC